MQHRQHLRPPHYSVFDLVVKPLGQHQKTRASKIHHQITRLRKFPRICQGLPRRPIAKRRPVLAVTCPFKASPQNKSQRAPHLVAIFSIPASRSRRWCSCCESPLGPRQAPALPTRLPPPLPLLQTKRRCCGGCVENTVHDIRKCINHNIARRMVHHRKRMRAGRYP